MGLTITTGQDKVRGMNGRYFYTTSKSFQWHRGINIIHYNDDGDLIASLEEAKELARSHRKLTMQSDHVDTTFGVEYFD